jgi:hypothetical protein
LIPNTSRLAANRKTAPTAIIQSSDDERGIDSPILIKINIIKIEVKGMKIKRKTDLSYCPEFFFGFCIRCIST